MDELALRSSQLFCQLPQAAHAEAVEDIFTCKEILKNKVSVISSLPV